MKRIIGFNRSATIHVNEISQEHLIMVYKDNLPYGFIIWTKGKWKTISNMQNDTKHHDNLQSAFIWFNGECEFYVMEEKERENI